MLRKIDMKNVILLTIDSFTAQALDDKKYGQTAMPFFKELMEKSIYAKNHYTQGPHTEFGLQSLMTGMNTLDNSASLRGLVYAKKTIYDYFHEAGYGLSVVTWPSNFYPKRFQGIIKDYFTQGDSFILTLFWRLKYYVELYQKQEIQEQDYIDLIGCFSDSFNSYLNFLNIEAHDERAYALTKLRIHSLDLRNRYAIVKKEQEKFLQDKRKYVVDILENDGCLPECLTVDDNATQEEEESLHEKLEELYQENKRFLQTMKIKQAVGTLFDKRNSASEIMRAVFDMVIHREKPLVLRMMNWRIKSNDTFRLSKQNRQNIDCTSLKTQLEFLVDILDQNRNNEKPEFIYFHTLSQHDPTQWYSIDKSKEIIQQELEDAKKLIKNTHSYYGQYVYRLGLLYVDNCLKQFFTSLEEKGLLKNTVIVITADHGSSFCNNPNRTAPAFNNCHSELYHIPLLIYGESVQPRTLMGYYTHRDVIPTLMELCGMEIPFYGRGQSILDDSYVPDIALAERTPSGAPALLHKDVIYTARNKRYLVEYEANTFKPFASGRLVEVYDLQKDAEELKNIAKTVDISKIQDLITTMESRHKQLQENYTQWLQTDMGSSE